MARSFFSMGFRSDPFMGNPGVPGLVKNPLVLNLTYEEIKARNFQPLLHPNFPKGYSGVFPYVVKLQNNEGEFMVFADGTAQWTGYGSGNVGAPFRIK